MKLWKSKKNMYHIFLIEDKVYKSKIEQRVIGKFDYNSLHNKLTGKILAPEIGMQFLYKYKRLKQDSKKMMYLFTVKHIDKKLKILFCILQPEYMSISKDKTTLLDIINKKNDNNNNMQVDMTDDFQKFIGQEGKQENKIKILDKEILIPQEFFSKDIEKNMKDMLDYEEQKLKEVEKNE